MKSMSQWGQPIALFALVLSPMGGLNATASVVAGITSTPISEEQPTLSQQRGNVELAQGLIGECRAAARAMFVYPERSTSNPLRALQTDEKVTIAEESGRGGWIAISSPVNGFVQAQDLKLCSSSPPRTPPTSTPQSRCRRVSYEGTEGLAIRERPSVNSPRIGGVFFEDRVTLADPPQFRVDDEGREWVRITAPTAGWLSNGFPKLGDINLRACF
ncbi:MAG TPA: hypothetical protein DCY91_30105 [Cyanobacteria bacterium UBA11370]|nr:hypothetical protein [Cyanobacteria bacterium UBA11370]HBY76350.1 hypothetical protein [Cyanobacteria bacterium UBA11148]